MFKEMNVSRPPITKKSYAGSLKAGKSIGFLLLEGMTRTLKTDSGISKVTNITSPIARTVQPNPILLHNLWKMIGYKIPPGDEIILAIVQLFAEYMLTQSTSSGGYAICKGQFGAEIGG